MVVLAVPAIHGLSIETATITTGLNTRYVMSQSPSTGHSLSRSPLALVASYPAPELQVLGAVEERLLEVGVDRELEFVGPKQLRDPDLAGRLPALGRSV